LAELSVHQAMNDMTNEVHNNQTNDMKMMHDIHSHLRILQRTWRWQFHDGNEDKWKTCKCPAESCEK